MKSITLGRSHALSRKPKRYSKTGLDRYCSPACGYDCTLADYMIARSGGAMLIAALGPPWQLRLWENVGWHYSAELKVPGVGEIVVHRFAPRDFWISIIVGEYQYQARGTTPTKARSAVRLAMRMHATDVERVVRALED